MAVCKGAQAGAIGCAQGLQVAQHQRRHRIAHRQLDLRAGLARVHAAKQLAQRQQQRAHMGRQHRTDAHIGHIAALAFVKADQHLPFFVHVAHRQPGPVAVAPCRACNGRQDRVRADLGQVPEVVFQHALLDRHLGRRIQMLHLAAAASPGVQAKVWATRLHAQGRLAVYRAQVGLFPLVFAAPRFRADPFGGQGAINEHHLAVGAPRHPLGIEVHGIDAQPARRWQAGARQSNRFRTGSWLVAIGSVDRLGAGR